MNIPKAIEIMTDLLGESPYFPPDDRRDAVRLAIEALTYISFLRETNPEQVPLLFHDETPVSDPRD